MNRACLAGVFVCAAACSPAGSGVSTSAAGAGSGGGEGGAGSTSSVAGGTGSAGGDAGAGGAASCSACITIARLPLGSKPQGLFVDDHHVYWTNSGSGEVMQAGLDGSSPVTLTSGEVAPVAVQVAGGFVYWASYSEAGVVRRAPVDGGAVVDLAPAPAARELHVGSGFLFWTGEPDDIQRAPVNGLAAGAAPDLLTNNTLPNGLTADETSVYWVNRFDGQVKKADHDLGHSASLGSGDIPWDVAVDATSIYWTEQGSPGRSGRVMKASKLDGSGATVLASEATGPRGIALDATRVYWTNRSDGTIKAAPIAGGPAIVLAAGQREPASVVVDDGFVYWTSSGDDAIVKVAK